MPSMLLHDLAEEASVEPSPSCVLISELLAKSTIDRPEEILELSLEVGYIESLGHNRGGGWRTSSRIPGPRWILADVIRFSGAAWKCP